ncbi:hypothetical protein LCGC14_2060750, partial [marine sediment metagenome]
QFTGWNFKPVEATAVSVGGCSGKYMDGYRSTGWYYEATIDLH